MKTSITARHCEITDDLRDRATALIERMERFSPHALEGHVIFDVEPDGQLVELKLHVRRGLILVGVATADDHRTALDRAEEKLRRQLEKATTQSRRTRRSPSKP